MRKILVVFALISVLCAMLAAGCSASSTTSPASTIPVTSSSVTPQVITVLSVSGPIPPFNPGGPVVAISLKNISDKLVVAVTCTLVLNRSFDFTFDVSSAKPWLPNSTINTKQTLIGAGISDSQTYPLTITGSFQDGGTFNYTNQVKITAPTTTPTAFSQTSSMVTSANGLSLTLTIDSTAYQAGDKVSISIDEKNSLAKGNNVPAANIWPVQGLIVSPCGTLNYPFGIFIAQGYYDTANLASVTPLQLYDPYAPYACPMILAGITAYNFQPLSDIAAISAAGNSSALTINMTTQIKAAGCWSGSPTATFNNFTPGIYTIAAGDEWGLLTVLHFTIS